MRPSSGLRHLVGGGIILSMMTACSEDSGASGGAGAAGGAAPDGTCDYDGSRHSAGELFRTAGSQCCGCRSDGSVECLELACGDCLAFLPGESFEKAPDCICICGTPGGGGAGGGTGAGIVCEGLGCVPPEWACDPLDWNGGVGNGCQCQCGSRDPDCGLSPGEVVEGCANADDVCSYSGQFCVPATWSCDAVGSYGVYGNGSCDCGCGAQDVDCADLLLESCEDCYIGCSQSECPGTISPADNTVCN